MKDVLGAARNVSNQLYKLLTWAKESFLCSEKASEDTDREPGMKEHRRSRSNQQTRTRDCEHGMLWLGIRTKVIQTEKLLLHE